MQPNSIGRGSTINKRSPNVTSWGRHGSSEERDSRMMNESTSRLTHSDLHTMACITTGFAGKEGSGRPSSVGKKIASSRLPTCTIANANVALSEPTSVASKARLPRACSTITRDARQCVSSTRPCAISPRRTRAERAISGIGREDGSTRMTTLSTTARSRCTATKTRATGVGLHADRRRMLRSDARPITRRTVAVL